MTGKEETIKDYQERINKVLVYISEHLDEKLDLEKLAAMSNFSVYHFHRIFRAFLNEPLGTFVTRLRLDQAARLLEYTDHSIKDIAYQVGFEAASSLNKAFKKRFEITPAKFRVSKKALIPFEFIHSNVEKMDLKLKPQIKTIKDKKVVYVQAIGKYAESAGEAWSELCEFMKQEKLFGFGLETIGIGHDDPSVTETEKLRYDACMTVKKQVNPKGKVGVKVIEGGKYAIFKYKGPYTNLEQVYNFIFKNWLPASEYELEDKPSFEKYLNDPEKTKPENYKTQIYVPIK